MTRPDRTDVAAVARYDALLDEMRALRREVINFRPRTELVLLDSKWIERAQAAEVEVARLKVMPRSPIAEKPGNSVIAYAEAHALFGGYVDSELQRLGEKLAAIEAGNFDTHADDAWKARNQTVGAAAVVLEAKAHLIAQEQSHG